MSSVVYDNNVYDEISSETKCRKENAYEVPEKLVSKKPTGGNQPLGSFSISNTKNKCTIALTLAVVVLVFAVVAACVVFALEIVRMKTEMSRLSTLSENLNKMTLQNSETIPQQPVSTLSELLDSVTVQMTQDYSSRIRALASSTNISLQQVIDEMVMSQQAVDNVSDRLDNVVVQVTQDFINKIQQLASSSNTSLQQLYETVSLLHSGSIFYPVSSCTSLPPSFSSGYYWVKAANGSVVHVYCDMTMSCGGVTGGWMRVAELDMTNSRHQCPSGLQRGAISGFRTCVRESSSPGCSSVIYSTSNLNYTSVCGRVIAYQYGYTDAFNRGQTINSVYVDGVSLTHGSPRTHIWTFASAHDEVISDGAATSCPCIDARVVNRASAGVPSFVGDDYFCDTGNHNGYQYAVHFVADPLWDGAGCGNNSTCCSFNNPPWFYKQLSQPTTDDIEMRVCRNEVASNEDIEIQEINLYVR